MANFEWALGAMKRGEAVTRDDYAGEVRIVDGIVRYYYIQNGYLYQESFTVSPYDLLAEDWVLGNLTTTASTVKIVRKENP